MWELRRFTASYRDIFLALIETSKTLIHANDKHEGNDEGNAVFCLDTSGNGHGQTRDI
jgi:hypothetical protein